MRVSKAFETVVLTAIRRVAIQDSDLKKPEVRALVYQLCCECYRVGVAEMQEPIRRLMDEPKTDDDDSRPWEVA